MSEEATTRREEDADGPNDSLVQRYERSTLQAFATDYLAALGATPEEASVVGTGMVTAAARWHPGKGQGLEKLFRLTEQCKCGGIVPGAPAEVLKETPCSALLDAHKGFGYAAADRAMRLAVEKAGQCGIGVAVVRHSNHFGQAGFHAETATKAGMIGIAMTNALAELAPWGGKTAALGTNPWGLGIPRRSTVPILLDMALSPSGQGMILWAARENRDIPDNWALTLDGRRSTNPTDFIADDGQTFVGTQLPMGDFKGYGLSLFTDVVTGVLGGSLFGTDVFRDITNHDVGHLLMALNPRHFVGEEEFYTGVEELVAQIREVAPLEETTILLPGEREFATEEECSRIGVPVDRSTAVRLKTLAAELGVPCPL
jgi:LDH2 family malate/lactate/ureidoglycolate dehydrogenase